MAKGREGTQCGQGMDKGVICVLDWTEWYAVRFRHAAQSGVQFKAYELYVFGIFLFNNFGSWLTAGN